MQRYTLTAANAATHVPEYPERTARRTASGFLNFDVEYQVWPSRGAMLTSIRMGQQSGRPTWRACVLPCYERPPHAHMGDGPGRICLTEAERDRISKDGP